jgi:hypothetical protein
MLQRLIGAFVALFLLAGPALADQRAMVVVGGGTIAAARFSTASVTSYVPIGGATSEVVQGANIALAQVAWRGAGTFSNFNFDPATNTRTTDVTVCLNVNGADVLCKTWTTGSPLDARFDASSVAIADGDLVCLSVTLGSGAGVFSLAPVSWQFTTTGQVFTHLNSAAPNGAAAVTAARNNVAGGRLDTNNVEANVNVKALEAFTASHVTAALSSNAGSAAVFKLRKNNADSSVSLTTGTGIGVTEAAGSEAIAADDVFNITKNATGSAVTTTRVGLKYTGAVPGRVMQMAAGVASLSATTYVGPGASTAGETTESSSQVRVPFASTVSKLSVLITATASTSDIQVDLMKNGVSVRSFTVPFGGSFPGTFTDPSGAEDAFAAGDLLDVRISGMNAAVGVNAVTFLMTDTNATTGGNNGRRLLLGVR